MVSRNLLPFRQPTGARVILVALILASMSSPAFADEGGAINWVAMAIGLFGGLALFLFGMEQMTVGLKAAAGEIKPVSGDKDPTMVAGTRARFYNLNNLKPSLDFADKLRYADPNWVIGPGVGLCRGN